tara:strand:+ start:4176 stop:5648 length:1473 start_codon:yes stop_codon:yes gene_type:complete
MDIIHDLKVILKKYRKNPILIKKIRHHVKNQMPKLLEDFNEKQKNKEIVASESDKYIENFMNYNQYFYISKIFVEYDQKHYSIISEDDIWSKILKELSINKNLSKIKYSIKTTIIKEIKKNSVTGTIPGSFTIQYVLDHLYPTLFDSRDLAKYFLTVLGDNILKKNSDLVHFIDPISKNFMSYLNDTITSFLKGSPTSSFKYKYHDHDYSFCRIVNCNRSIARRACWVKFIKSHILDIIVVACHYSSRFGSSDGFLKKNHNTPFKRHVLFFKGKTHENIIKRFSAKLKKSKNKSISWNDMYFLWKIYCNHQQIPIMIYKEKVKEILEKMYNFDGEKFLGISSNILKNVRNILQFWSENIKEDEGNEYEISELCHIFTDWSGEDSVSETMMVFILNHFLPKIKIYKNRHVLDIKCIAWDKKKDILSSIDLLKMKYSLLENDVSFLKMYQDYCEEHAETYICSKEYYEKIVKLNIPKQYFNEHAVESSFWKI